MRCIHLLALFFLLLGCDGESSVESIPQDAPKVLAVRDENTNIFTTDYRGLNSRQLIQLEEILNAVYEGFFGSPPTKLSIRRNNGSEADLANTVSIIGDAVTRNFKSLFKKFGISESSHDEEYDSMKNGTESLRFAVFYQLLKMPLEMRPILREIQNRISKYMKNNNYVKFGYNGRSMFSPKVYGGSDSPMPGSEDTMDHGFSNNCLQVFYICLSSMKSGFFDIKKSVGSLLNTTPEAASRIIHRRLRKPIPEHPLIRATEHSETEAFICHLIAGEKWHAYHNCLMEIKRVDNCVTTECANYSRSGKTGVRIAEKSKEFFETVRSLDESCVSVGDDGPRLVECKNIGKSNWKNNVGTYVSDFIMGDLKKSPVLRRMADELLVTVVGTSGLGANVLRKMATLIGVYENGIQAREKLSKSKINDVRRYNELTKNLADYQRHVARMSLKAIGDANEIASNVEKFLVDSTSRVSRHDLSANVEALKCFSDLINSIIANLWKNGTTNSRRNVTEVFKDYSVKSVPNDDDASKNRVGFLKESLDESLGDWMNSMKRTAETSALRHRHSTALISLANTFLLATVFYECIALLATSIYQKDRETFPQSNDGENFSGEHWTSGEGKSKR